MANKWLILAIALFAVAALASGYIVTTAAAEDPPDAGDVNATPVEAEVDSQIRVLEYRYLPGGDDAGKMLISLENTGDSVTEVTLTELIDPSDGSGSFGVDVVTVRPGETVEASVDVELRDGSAGVMIVTPESIAAGTGTHVSHQERETGLISGAATWGDVRAAVIGTALFAAMLVVLGAWEAIYRKHRPAEEVDL